MTDGQLTAVRPLRDGMGDVERSHEAAAWSPRPSDRPGRSSA